MQLPVFIFCLFLHMVRKTGSHPTGSVTQKENLKKRHTLSEILSPAAEQQFIDFSHKDTWTGSKSLSLKRLRRPIIRPIPDGQYVEETVDGVILLTEADNNEVFVPEELIAATKQLLTRVPYELRTYKTPLAEKRPVRRHVTGTMMQGMPFSFQYIVDDEATQNFQTRHEVADSSAVVKGCYQLLEPTGLVRTVTYRADVSGFRIISMTKGPDKIPCSATADENIQTPFQRQFSQNTGSASAFSRANGFASSTHQEGINLAKSLNRDTTADAAKSSAQGRLLNQQQLETSLFSHEDDTVTQIRKQESILSYINNLSKTLQNSFRSDETDFSDYVNFPFVLIPITTFFQLRQKGHLNDIQGFGAIIQPSQSQKPLKSLLKNGRLLEARQHIQQSGKLPETSQRAEASQTIQQSGRHLKTSQRAQSSITDTSQSKTKIQQSYGLPTDRQSSKISSFNLSKESTNQVIKSNSRSHSSHNFQTSQTLHDSLPSYSQTLPDVRQQSIHGGDKSGTVSTHKSFETSDLIGEVSHGSGNHQNKIPEKLLNESILKETSEVRSLQDNDLISSYSNYEPSPNTEIQGLASKTHSSPIFSTNVINRQEFRTPEVTNVKTEMIPKSINGFEVPAISLLPLEESNENDKQIQQFLLPSHSGNGGFQILDQDSIESSAKNGAVPAGQPNDSLENFSSEFLLNQDTHFFGDKISPKSTSKFLSSDNERTGSVTSTNLNKPSTIQTALIQPKENYQGTLTNNLEADMKNEYNQRNTIISQDLSSSPIYNDYDSKQTSVSSTSQRAPVQNLMVAISRPSQLYQPPQQNQVQLLQIPSQLYQASQKDPIQSNHSPKRNHVQPHHQAQSSRQNEHLAQISNNKPASSLQTPSQGTNYLHQPAGTTKTQSISVQTRAHAAYQATKDPKHGDVQSQSPHLAVTTQSQTQKLAPSQSYKVAVQNPSQFYQSPGQSQAHIFQNSRKNSKQVNQIRSQTYQASRHNPVLSILIQKRPSLQSTEKSRENPTTSESYQFQRQTLTKPFQDSGEKFDQSHQALSANPSQSYLPPKKSPAQSSQFVSELDNLQSEALALKRDQPYQVTTQNPSQLYQAPKQFQQQALQKPISTPDLSYQTVIPSIAQAQNIPMQNLNKQKLRQQPFTVQVQPREPTNPSSSYLPPKVTTEFGDKISKNFNREKQYKQPSDTSATKGHSTSARLLPMMRGSY